MSAKRRPSLASSGYTTVDVLLNGALRAAPGGTASNVARAALTLGWSSAVIGTIGDDPAGRFVSEQLHADGIDTTHLYNDHRWTTPVLVQEAHLDDHRWRFQCPICGTKFASYRPPSEDLAAAVVDESTTPDVFFFDRVSRFTLELARRWREHGSFVVFEPSTVGRSHLFDQAVQAADLIKFSSQRAPAFRDRLVSAPGLIVETLGSSGARYRRNIQDGWVRVAARPIEDVVDSAGAGDWTTAGLINDLLLDGHVALERIESALIAGQELAARSLSWEGVHPEAMRRFDIAFEPFGCPRVTRSR
ncbi:ribokinase [Plantibacter sp. CFBP 8775]|nr:ribokinase [Plantibacter sp. CFBP 8775]